MKFLTKYKNALSGLINSLFQISTYNFNMKIIIHSSFFLFFHRCSQVVIFAHGNYQVSNIEFDIFVKNDTKFMNIDKLKIKRKNRNETHKFYGSFEIYQDVTKDIHVRIEVFVKQGGEYRKTPYHVKGPFCRVIETDLVLYPSIRAAAGLPKKVRWQ